MNNNSYFNSTVLYQYLDEKRKVLNLSWRDLAKKLEISNSTFTRLSQGSKLDIDSFLACLLWLNVPFETFINDKYLKPEQHSLSQLQLNSFVSLNNSADPRSAIISDILALLTRHLVKQAIE